MGQNLVFNASFPFSDFKVMHPVCLSQTAQPEELLLLCVMT